LSEEEPSPVLFVDVDGVISLFDFDPNDAPPGRFHLVDGLHHYIAGSAGEHLGRLAEAFELVWATGWEHRANEHLPSLLALPGKELPTLSFDEQPVWGTAHWKVSAVDRYARGRSAAWIDDSLDETCEAWAERRSEPTLLVPTEPATGITEEQVGRLLEWAAGLRSDEARFAERMSGEVEQIEPP
jgi:hypothetical protein